MDSQGLGIYIHVPYCKVVCPYCDFVKRATNGAAPTAFVDALLAEIDAFEGSLKTTSVSFGGGTPSLLTSEDLGRILERIHAKFHHGDPEISIEANPDDITGDVLTQWSDHGINRVHLGVQSFDDEVLKHLGRCHDSSVARRACEDVKGAFANWGLDLIFGAPPIHAWQSTLEQALRFEPPHISCYGLTYEEGTPFWNERDKAIDSDVSLMLYRHAMTALSAYEHYEVSNFARDGFYSRHNQIYWRNEPYVGFGPGAYSYSNGTRARNEPNIQRYLEHPGRKVEELILTPQEVQIETLIQHFRTHRGIRHDYWATRFDGAMHDDFDSELRTLIDRGLLEETEHGFRPTQLGYELNNEIGMALVS